MTVQTPAQVRMAAARAARKPKAGAFNGADPAKFDHDGDGAAGGSRPKGALPPTPAQAGLAAEREEAREAKAAVAADMEQSLSEEVIAQARAQREARDAAELAAAQAAARDEAAGRGVSPAPTRGELAGIKAEQEARARQDAARRVVAGEAPDTVSVRVLKAGADRISMGVHATGIGDAHYKRGDVFSVATSIAQALEERGFVEIEA